MLFSGPGCIGVLKKTINDNNENYSWCRRYRSKFEVDGVKN